MLENIPLLIYLASVAESFRGFAALFGFLGIVLVFALAFFLWVQVEESMSESEDEKLVKIISTIKKGLSIVAVYFGLCTFIPSENTILTMVAAGGAVELVQSDAVQEVGGKSLQLLNQFLDSKLEIQDEQSN